MPRSETTLKLYIRHRGKLVTYANSIIGDSARAEDVVQDAWLKLSQASHREQVHNPLSLLFRIVRNLSIDIVRKAKRSDAVIADLDGAAEILIDPQPSAEVSLMARQELGIVLETLHSLPERQRRAIELYRFKGYKLREVAEDLGISKSLAQVLIIDGLALCSALRAKAER